MRRAAFDKAWTSNNVSRKNGVMVKVEQAVDARIDKEYCNNVKLAEYHGN